MRYTAVFAAFLILGGSAFAADPQLLNLVMPDAKVMAGLNVTNAKISPLGQYLLTRIAGSDDKGLQSFVSETGFDPRQDVTEILAASAAGGQPGLILARGTFDVAKISAAAAKDSHAKVQQYGGATLIVMGDGKLSHTVAFIGTGIAVVGDTASVKAALDRSTGNNAISPALAARVQQLSTSQDAWSISVASIAALLPNVGVTVKGLGSEMLGIVKDIQESSGGLKLGANVEVTAQAVTSDPKNATALGDLIKMAVSLSAMAGGNDPKLGELSKLLQQVQVTTTGPSVNIALSVPEAQVEALLKPVAQAKTAVR